MRRTTQKMENRQSRVNERKNSFEQAHVQRIQIKVERDHSNAEQKRSSALVEMMKKLKDHNSKVNQVLATVTTQEQQRIESKKERL